MTHYRYCIFVLFAMVLDGCSKLSEVSDDEVVSIYNGNAAGLNEIVGVCDRNSAIKRVGAERDSLSLVDEDALYNTDDVSDVREILAKIGVEGVLCNRDRSKKNAPLVSVMVLVYTKGLSVSGSGVALVYLSEHAVGIEEDIQSGDIKRINHEWYIRRM
ncbi:hypothetical protein ONV78_23805 [Hahella sp. CR1]|uniref:hypothetical protein n=1 Tax=Hahella sp. CR1 TaxID=2992807 RepID=UPI0024435C62|nr:hypothetical protein [Hahella sp. CR1]MDG9670784.1 hypothetical protein [Hahella sp. CR1]